MNNKGSTCTLYVLR